MYRRVIYLTALFLTISLAGSASADLVAQWKLDEGGGTTALDATGNGNEGTLEGDPVSVPGQFLEALSFDDSRVVILASDSLGADLFQGSFTMSCWINPTRSGNTWQQIFRAVAVSGSNDTLFLNNDGRLSWRGRVNGGWAGGMCETAADVVPADQWTHVAVTGDGTNFRVYVNGELSQESAFQTTDGANETYYIGGTSGGESYAGMVDDLRVYDHALTEDDVRSSMENQGGAIFKAFGADPRSGTMLEATWVSMSWRAGDFAVSHDVYLGDNFDDVNNGAESAFQGNLGATSLIAGFAGFPFPDGLVPGTTYYWRVDEVNPDEPNSPWKGDIWSFWIPPKTAYNPSPAPDGKYVATDAELSWTAGFGAKLHTVYFGDDLDTVTNAAGGMMQSATTFTPGALELDKTYYWRVDEFDALTTYTGDVWSFTTTLPGLGKAVAARWENIPTTDINTLKTNARYPNNPDVTEDVTEFAWDGPDLSDYGGRIEAWVYAPSTGDFTFWLNSDDQGELWLSTDDDPGSAKLIARESSWSALNAWPGGEEKSDPIALIGGEKYYIMAIWKEGGGGDHCQVAWQGPGIPERTVIAGTNLSPFEPMSAYGAKPSNRSTDVTQVPILTWKAGLQAASHEVYFGTDEQAVTDATKASPEYKGSRQLGSESLDPGKLDWNATYFWRVDEIDNTNPESPWVGAVWSFTTADFLIVDDFESYDDVDPAPGEPGLNRIFDKWIDGFGTLTNGALVGNDMPPYAERTIVHTGAQSMIYRYDNAGKTSEATLTLVYPRDWTEGGVTKLSLWVNGSAANAADRIYVALNGTAVIYHDDPSATQIADWTEWVIDLAAFGVNLANVNTITIGVGTKNAPVPGGGTGTLYFDDIRLVR